jgi:hypothetical protein
MREREKEREREREREIWSMVSVKKLIVKCKLWKKKGGRKEKIAQGIYGWFSDRT